MLPGIDDGCESIEESIACIDLLKQAGYVGTICTPHLWPDMFPDNTPVNIQRWTDSLQDGLANRGIDYALWPGGELRLFPGVIEWVKTHGVPTLADSRYVLADFWEESWPDYVDEALDWFLAEGYQPILAHPERIGITKLETLTSHLDAITARGVLLQGNFRCMTGEDGYLQDQRVRQFLTEQRYWLMAMDMHRPDALPSRLDGMQMVVEEFGQAVVDEMTIDRPRTVLATP
jgi:protein-tyrosine phosphatase